MWREGEQGARGPGGSRGVLGPVNSVLEGGELDGGTPGVREDSGPPLQCAGGPGIVLVEAIEGRFLDD